MTEKRMLIVPAELVKKIDDNRGDMSQAEFIDYLIEGQLGGEGKEPKYVTWEEIGSLKQDIKKLIKEEIKGHKYATTEEFQSFEQDTRKLLKRFFDFFIGYGLELGKQSPKNELEEFTSKLKGLEDELVPEGEDREVKVKWK